MAGERWTIEQAPDQSGRTAIVTGANTGLGLEIAKALAAKGARVVLACRSRDKGLAAIDAVAAVAPGSPPELIELDLASAKSIEQAAEEILAENDRIDLLVNNAGVMYPPRTTTADGFELQLGTNHLGHFALTGRLLGRMLQTPGSRVVTMSSVGHKFRADIHFDDLQLEHGYDRVKAYGQSKLANLMFTYELQRRLANAGAETEALAAHPGFTRSELMRHSPGWLQFLADTGGRLFYQGPAEGATPALRAAIDPAAKGGQYYGPSGFMELQGDPVLVQSTARSHDQQKQMRLWQESEHLTAVTYPV